MGVVVAIFVAILAIWLIGKLTGIVIGLLLAGLAGYFASRVLGGDGAGTVGNVLLGLGGGVVGPFILGMLDAGGIGNIPLVGAILSSVIGAVVIIFIARLFDKNFAK